jgi:hypothetical protein
MIARQQARGFRAYLDRGALLIADATWRRRDVSRYLPIDEVFDAIVAGLAGDPGLLAAAGLAKEELRKEEAIESEAAADGAR